MNVQNWMQTGCEGWHGVPAFGTWHFGVPNGEGRVGNRNQRSVSRKQAGLNKRKVKTRTPETHTALRQAPDEAVRHPSSFPTVKLPAARRLPEKLMHYGTSRALRRFAMCDSCWADVARLAVGPSLCVICASWAAKSFTATSCGT